MLHGGVYNARAMARRGDFVYCFFAPALSDYNFIQSEILYRAENDYRYGMPHSRTYCIILYPTPSTPHTASRSPDNPGAGPRGDESREVCSCLRDRPSVTTRVGVLAPGTQRASWGYGVLRIPARVLGYGVPRTPPAPPKKPYPGGWGYAAVSSGCPPSPRRRQLAFSDGRSARVSSPS